MRAPKRSGTLRVTPPLPRRTVRVPERSRRTTYYVSAGPAGPGVEAIVVGPDGALWFGTDVGVSRFDGATSTNYTTRDGLAYDRVVSIAVAADGAMWFGTYGEGVSRYVPAK